MTRSVPVVNDAAQGGRLHPAAGCAPLAAKDMPTSSCVPQRAGTS